MSPTYRCPECGAVLPGGSPQAPCPACLMQLGLTAGHDTPLEVAGQAPELGPTHVPTPDRLRAAAAKVPSPAELAGLFPELEILRLLGHGGMGAVYQARQTGLDRYVALKIIMPEVAGEAGFAERFVREARVLARLNHPHIVTIHDFGQRSGLHYLIMEYVDGVNLREVLRTGRMAPAEALRIIPPVCEALQYAHEEGVVHRDIKPENILVDRKGRVKIADFGLARLAGYDAQDLNLTGTRQVVGTPRYMAPEQMQGARAVDHRVDLYSLGVVFYEMLTGEVPMGRFAPPSHHVPLDRRVDDVVLRALESDPNRRYQHAYDIKSDVETISKSGLLDHVPTQVIQEPFPALLTLPVICQLLFGGLQIMVGLVMYSMAKHDLNSADPTLSVVLFIGLAGATIVTGCLALASAIWYFATGSTLWLRRGAIGLMIPTSIAWVFGLPVGVWTLRRLTRQQAAADALREVPTPQRVQRGTPSGSSPELTAAAISLLLIACLQMLAPVAFYFLLNQDGSAASPMKLIALGAILSLLTGGIAMLAATSFLAGASVGWLRSAALALVFPCNLTWILGFPVGLWTLRIISGLSSRRRTYAVRNDGPWASAAAPASPRPREVPSPQTPPGSVQLSSPWSGLEWAQKAVRRMSRQQQIGFGVVCGVVFMAAFLACWSFGWGNVHEAARSGNSMQVAAQLLLGARIDGRDERGMTPLMWAAWERHPDIVRQLLDRGADPNQKDDEGETALMKAAFRGNLPSVTVLLQRKASVNESDNDGETALLVAAAEGHVSIVQVLLGYNADPRAASRSGATPLIVAAFNGHSSLVNLLLPLSQVDAKDRSGETALIKACARGYYPIVEELLASKADVNIANVTGHTAQRLAISGGYAAIVDALAAKGATLNPLYYFFQGFREARAGNYAVAADKLRSAAGAVSNPMPTPSGMTFDDWRYEITAPQIYAWILVGECEQRLGNAEAARAAWQMAAEKLKAGVPEIRLYRRELNRPERHIVETFMMAPGEITKHLTDPKQPWHLMRHYEDEERGPGRSFGRSGQEGVDVPDLFR